MSLLAVRYVAAATSRVDIAPVCRDFISVLRMASVAIARMSNAGVIGCSVIFVFSACFLNVSAAKAANKGSEALSSSGAIPISVAAANGVPICQSFAFAQVPNHPDRFVGKYTLSKGTNICGGSTTLALFGFDWNTHIMTLLHTIMPVPQNSGNAIITAAYDPYLEFYNNEVWVSFECTGLHIAGASACIAPLSADLSKVDTSRLSIAVSGEDSDPKSPFEYSASTPKLLNYSGQMYLFWSAIKVAKATHAWVSQEERGVALDKQANGKFMPKGHTTNWLPSHTPGQNMTVLAPTANDPLRNASMDVEGFFTTSQGVLALTSIGGSGPNGSCLKPHDKIPGCYMLEIERASGNPLREHAFNTQRAIDDDLPANPMEYPRIITGPNNQTYLMANIHPLYSGVAPKGKKVLTQTGYVVIPISLQQLVFRRTG